MINKLFLFMISSLLLFFVVVIPAHALIDPGLQGDYAAGTTPTAQSNTSNQPCFTSASGILGLNGQTFTSTGCSPEDLARFMQALDEFFYRLAVVLAVLMVTVGGMQWLMAIGNSSKISQAKETIQQALLGLVLAFTAILLFNQIDTSFTAFDTSKIVSLTPSPEVPCEQRKSAVACSVSATATNGCYWEPTDASNFFGAGNCKPINCSQIKTCSQYPPNEEICTMNNGAGFCNLIFPLGPAKCKFNKPGAFARAKCDLF